MNYYDFIEKLNIDEEILELLEEEPDINLEHIPLYGPITGYNQYGHAYPKVFSSIGEAHQFFKKLLYKSAADVVPDVLYIKRIDSYLLKVGVKCDFLVLNYSFRRNKYNLMRPPSDKELKNLIEVFKPVSYNNHSLLEKELIQFAEDGTSEFYNLRDIEDSLEQDRVELKFEDIQDSAF